MLGRKNPRSRMCKGNLEEGKKGPDSLEHAQKQVKEEFNTGEIMEHINTADSNSLINHTTPHSQVTSDTDKFKQETEWNRCARDDTESETSYTLMNGNILSALLEDSVGDDLLSKCSSQTSIPTELNTLKLRSNRGRPKKLQLNKETRILNIKKEKKG